MSLSDSEGSDAVVVGPGDIRDFNKENILPLPAEDLKRVRDWLQPTPYDLERSEFSRHLESYLAGTGRWLTSTKTYQQWHEGEANGLLWIKGIPGSGKSVMAASIIHELHKEDVPVLYFFFRQIIDANHQPVAALRDWLCQILPFSPPLQVKLKKEYLDHRRSIDSLAANDLWKDIKFALSAFPKAYCITDALDEMDQGNDDFLHALVELGQWRPANLKVLITSRPVVAVETPLRPFSVPSLRLEENLVDMDIAAYVRHRLHSSSVPQEYWNLITEAVPGRANGLFLYARLSMDAFTRPGADAQDILKKLPADLNVMYNDLLREHANRSNVPDDLQLLILQSITHATRPLRLLEVAEMIKATHAPLRDCSLKEIKDLVRAACGPLLQILHDETVSVVHHSFTEFLKGFTRSVAVENSTYPILEAGPTNQRLAIACLDYLMSGCLDKLEIKKRSKDDEFYWPKKEQQSGVRLQFPFLEYASTNWYIHFRRATLAGVDMSSLYAVLDSLVANKQRFLAWLDIDWPESVIQGLTPLHASAKTGLAQYAVHLIQKRDADPNVKSNRGDPPLYWAASSGHADVAQVLIDNGADPDGEAEEGLKPLHAAARKNHPDVVKVLLAAGVSPFTPKTRETPGRHCGNAPTSVGQTPLMYACNNGHSKVVAEFLPYLTDPDAITKALFWSAGSGRAACVDLILQHATVDVNTKYRDETLLFRACHRGDLNTIKLLLNARADPNIFCSYPYEEFGGIGANSYRMRQSSSHLDEPRGYTALHALLGLSARHGHHKVTPEYVSVLLEAGADIHLKCPDGRTALHLASNIDVIKMLLEAGADPYARTDSGATILHTDGSTDKELLPALIESGLVDVNKIVVESNGGPLFSRLKGYHSESALEFLKYISDPNITTPDGNGLLHELFNHSSWTSKSAALDALLSAGADPNLQNKKGEAPLHLLPDETKPETVTRLLKAGANLEIRDAQGQTPLFKSVTSWRPSGGELGRFKLLLEQGARLDTRDNKGRTLLHQVAKDTSRLDELISLMDFDPSVVDNKGNTLFLELPSRKTRSSADVSAYSHLKKLGVDIDQPNNRGTTVLHKLCSQKSGARSWVPSTTTSFDYVLQECKNLSPPDIDGIQPLHIAAAVSEAYVFKLLIAGADLFGVTKEGMTVLHVAARARQPGVIGLVLSKIADLEEEKLKVFINQRNSEGDAALHYACCSGRPESVDILLAAGADPNLPGKDGQKPLRACAEFEVEQARWKSIGEKDNGKAIKTASIWLGDRSVPSAEKAHDEVAQRRMYHVMDESHSMRLDEILVSLVLHGAAITGDNGSLLDALHAAVSNQRDYTAECLARLQTRFSPDLDLLEGSDDDDFILCKTRLEAERASLRTEWEKKRSAKITGHSRSDMHVMHLVNLLRHRQYSLLEELLQDFDIHGLNSIGMSMSLLHKIVDAGLSDLLSRVCTPEAASKFDDHEWCNQAETSGRCNRSLLTPLLIKACKRELPNMEVVRVLVEKMGVDINVNCGKISYARGKSEFVLGNGVLHDLAEGAHWWHVHQALPYIIKKGANLELRNDVGETALHIALDHGKFKGVFCKEAVKILLENGADANAVDPKGETCLSKAGDDTELIKLLISHGAEVSPVAVFSAIELGNVELLESFLSQGDLANTRRPAAGALENRGHHALTIRIPREEMCPLLHAATYDPRPNHRPGTNKLDLTPALRKRMMTALLQHGADPYATFVKFLRVENDSITYDGMLDESDGDSKEKWEPETCTVIHEILMTGKMVEPLLELPSLQLESRDDRGRTLIHCTRHIMSLADRGADMIAQDKSGKTVVHTLLQRCRSEPYTDDIEAILAREPKLVHIGDENGDTPLHYVLRAQKIHFQLVDLLLEKGADPLQPDSNGNTALHFIAKNPISNKKRIQQFLDLGLEINARNKDGNTPLSKYLAKGSLRHNEYWSASKTEGHADLDGMICLKDFGADFFATNNAGMSLLHVVAGRKPLESPGYVREDMLEAPTENVVSWFKFLMDMGLDPMLEDAQQRTSLDVAAACGHEHILKLFKPKPIE